MPPVHRAMWRRSAPHSAPAIPCSSANAGSDEAVASSSPERDSKAGISAFRIWSFGPSRNDIARLFLQMRGQEVEAALFGDPGVRGIVTCPFIAVETMLGAG